MLEVSEIQFELKMNELQFKEVLQQAVDDAFTELLNIEKESVYNYLESAFKIKKQEIPDKLVEFTAAIETIFGLSASLIAIKIMANIHKRIGDYSYYPPSTKLDFCDYLLELKEFMK